MATSYGDESPFRQARERDAARIARLWLRAMRTAAAGAPPVLGGLMSVHGYLPSSSGREGEAGHPGHLPQAAPGRELRVARPGRGPGDLSAGPVGVAGREPAEPAAERRPASAGSNPVFALGGLRAGRPGSDHPASGAAEAGRDRLPIVGGGDRERLSGGNLARG